MLFLRFHDKRIFWILLLSFCAFMKVQAQTIQKRVYHAVSIEEAPQINGILDDEAWGQGEWSGDFTQHEPFEGKAPSQKTEFKLCFDNNHLYIAFRALDEYPDSIVNRLDRRDHADGDVVFIILDSYHDLQTGFFFGVNSAGVREDVFFSENGELEDSSWDPIWEARVKTFDWGWAAEMKIPLTQLRFQKNSSQVWGFEAGRKIFRNDEMSLWQHVPRNSPGFIFAIGELDGIQEIRPKKQLDLTPYAVASVKSYEAEEGNPFSDGSGSKFNAGLDAKIGVTNNLTLDLTLFPDFGQVEADPSEVNLSAYETFFRERRPFFIEGNNITSFNVGLGDGDVGNDNLFYSRRIGRRPHADPELDEGEFANIPINANILAAAKLTGKTEKGLSIGVLESITSEVFAEIDSAGNRSSEQVEPLTSFSLVRLRKDFNKANTILGAAFTNTYRNLNNPEMEWLHRNATTAGMDFTHYFNNRYYRINGSLYGSLVNGTPEAISETQQSSARYFQRPGASYLDFDPDRTSLSGYGGKFGFGRIGGHWNFIFMSTWKSPGLELNDMGYMREADKILNVAWTGYNFTEPFWIFRSISVNNDIFTVLDFGGNLNAKGYEVNANVNFNNFWNLHVSGGYTGGILSNSVLRGGPAMYLPDDKRLSLSLESNDRKKIMAELEWNIRRGEDNYFSRQSIGLDIDIRPSNTLSFSLYPEYSRNDQILQYIDQLEMSGEDRYIFGTISQDVLSFSLRMNYTISPDLTVQYWGQPFLASGKFSEFKRITDPLADQFENRFMIFEQDQISIYDDTYSLDENMDGIEDYSFEIPDFNFNEWLSNLVVRWEFRPGSTAYLVWSQNRDYSSSMGDFDLSENLNRLYTDKKAYNVFLIKFSWRIGLN